MFNYDQTLPGLDHLIASNGKLASKKQRASKWQEQGVQTDPQPSGKITESETSSSSSSSSASSSSANSSSSCKSRLARSLADPACAGGVTNCLTTWPLPVATQPADEQVKQQQKSSNCILLLNTLPPVVNNSALVRQRASAKDSLAAATLTAGASVPLMAGGACRGQCLAVGHQQEDTQQVASSVVPKNTALRAEQRKQNMVSVVRPVVCNNTTAAGQDCNLGGLAAYAKLGGRVKLEDSPIWSQQQQQQKECSVLEDFMMLDKQVNLGHLAADADSPEDYLSMGHVKTRGGGGSIVQDQYSEQQARQQAILFRREEFELNKGLRRQHRLVVGKLEERKRGLQIVQAVWAQRGFKQAIESLVDIYHQGLIFTAAQDHLLAGQVTGKQQQHQQLHQHHQNGQATRTTLNSLNTSLVVDVLSVIVLRPKLWNLETCQLLLPIINNDLLMQHKPGYEAYQEVALKTIKLILTHFSSVIVGTLNNHQKVVTSGVDLSREDRLNKCSASCKLLLEARAQVQLVVARQASGPNRKLSGLYRELEQLFAAFESSLQPETLDSILMRRAS